MLASEYEDDAATHYGVMAHFTCIHDVPVWPFDLGVMSHDATWVVNQETKF